MCREGISFLNAILALSLETVEFPAEYFNEYSLTLRGRATQGVRIIRLKENDAIASVAKVTRFEADEELITEENSLEINQDIIQEESDKTDGSLNQNNTNTTNNNNNNDDEI